VNNFAGAALAPHNPQRIYALAGVNVAFVIAPDFYGRFRAIYAP
jgi:hypothetical protein